MARKTSLIAEVDDSKETWKLGVRITNLWVVEKSSKVNAMEMIFMDQKGGKITAVVKKFDIDKWKSMLKEDNTYIVQNFEVNHNDGQFRTSNHPYKLVFMKGTIVQARQIPEIPHNIYHFTPFDDILAGGASTEVLVDLEALFVLPFSLQGMARKTSLIAEVDDSKETWKLGVRITNLWVVEKSSKVNAMEMIFMDQKGGKITAVVKKFDIDKWKSMLKEDNTYIVQNFEVNHNDGQFRTSNHPYKLVFMKGTIVQARQIPEIPHNIYHFTPFDDILAGGASTEVLVDVIGELSDVVQIQKESVPKRVVLVLKDERNNTLHCTLWENYAARMISFLETHVEGHVVILLSLAKIKETNGKYPTTIQNSMYCSKLFIDEPLAEI
ncbi:uncharacterized protein LOC130727274 [Lotus japonicus]|uniref:uncharacterized protein LOC130727274 n=1 Tax=Lotus japonicus TaxID=34305 RepID=UPI0025870E71|nr:uncharacterized protein LOC130727274 [Lotus japonicus]